MYTRLQLRFRVWGSLVDHALLTDQFGIAPTRAFNVGEAPGKAANQVAGWEWFSEWSDRDAEPLVADFVRLFGPHVSRVRETVDMGASASLTVVGEVQGDLITTEAEAAAAGWSGGSGPDFAPFVANEYPWARFDAVAIRTLALMGADLDTHITFGLDRTPSDPEPEY